MTNQRPALVAFATSLTLLAGLSCQSPLRVTRNLSAPNAFVDFGIASGDIDGDGDVDLVVGADVRLLANDGRGRFVDATNGNVPPASYLTNAIDLADIDNDGDLDLLVANEALQNRVLVNDGTGSFTDVTTNQVPATTDFSIGQAVADFDGDGDLDWFIGNGGPDLLYRNDGAGVFTDVSATNLPAGVSTGYQVFAVDIEGDGDQDLFVSTLGSLPSILLNDGTGVFSPPAAPVPASGFRCHVADVDGDGLPDLFTDEGQQYHRNLGGVTFAPPVSLPFPTRGAVDIDADGDLDLLAEGMLLINDGNANFAPRISGGLSFGYRAQFAAADFDGDGDPDLMTGVLGGSALFTNLTVQLETPNPARRSHAYSIVCHVSPAATPAAPTLFGLAFAYEDLIQPTPFGVLRIDLAQGYLIPTLAVAGSTASRTWVVPDENALLGVELNLQAMVASPNRPLFLGNAVQDVVQ